MQGFDELLRDCRLLFGCEAVINRQFLEALQMPALKSAFRRRALSTHPDLFAGQARWIQKHHSEQFIGASEAYRRLSRYLTGRRTHADAPMKRRPAAARPAAAWRPRATREPHAWGESGFAKSPRSAVYSPQAAPSWPLRTGEFLYYSRLISWKMLISAIVWQRRQRERLGEIAQRWGWLAEDEILELVSCKYPGERLGEVLLRRASITPFQLSTLLWHQRKSQQPIGRFFVENKVITESCLRTCLADLEEHNRRCRPRRAGHPFDTAYGTCHFGTERAN